MAKFELPVWRQGTRFRLAAKLSHRFHGAYKVPTHDHPQARKHFTDSKVEPVASTWEVEVAGAPEEDEAPGAIELNLICSSPSQNPFSGLAYRLRLLRRKVVPDAEAAAKPEADEAPLRVRLAAVHTFRPPDPADEEGSGAVGRAILQPPSDQPWFEPSRELGFQFDFPVLLSDVDPGGDPEEVRRGGYPCFLETDLADGALVCRWACPFPAGPTIRTTLWWDPGRPWYRELRRERVYRNEDGSDETQLIARISLE